MSIDEKHDKIFNLMKLLLVDKSDAYKFISTELSFANCGPLVISNFAKSSGIVLKKELPLLELDSPNVIFSNLISSTNQKLDIELRMMLIDSLMKEYKLGKYSNSNDRDMIRIFCEDHGIKEIIHFTKIENAKGILDIGINSKLYNKEIRKKNNINDLNRFDYRTHMISLSISYPNDKMFYKYRMQDTNQEWVIFKLCPSLLWELDCLFCSTNAANVSISSRSESTLLGSQALANMFSDDFGGLRRCDPFDSQAEVLVNNHIPKKYIKAIVAEKETNFLKSLNCIVEIDQFYFNQRSYALRNYKH
ncbi:TPA: DarT ssDNA thymidine ADP-ribosyltransferase family protein [Vibrio harveyi]|uniref:DarT ssDNA thymidine ADP-ribosyltransferase family protein n=1 Tax=Vibrio harveyi TaxID=669 RepID=UPI0030F99B8D